MKAKQIVVNGVMYAPVKKASKTKEDIKGKNFEKSKLWYAKKGIQIVKEGFKAKMNTKKGIKEYDAVEFSNGKTGIVLQCGFIKYAWK